MTVIQLPPHTGATGQTPAALLHEADSTPRRLPRRELVGRVTSFVRDNLEEPVSIAELSRMVGVSERTLRAAFREALGLSPKQYTIVQRLRAVRAALQAADPKTTTVTDVAMAYGFFELGRFAGRYRLAFGESPSATLRQVNGAAAGEAERPVQAA
jgi:transcriptional regulator GlxA family with amidase domain